MVVSVLPRLTLRSPVTACARLCGWRLARSLWEMLREVRAVWGGEARLQSHRPVRQLARRVSRWGEVSLVLARPRLSQWSPAQASSEAVTEERLTSLRFRSRSSAGTELHSQVRS